MSPVDYHIIIFLKALAHVNSLHVACQIQEVFISEKVLFYYSGGFRGGGGGRGPSLFPTNLTFFNVKLKP